MLVTGASGSGTTTLGRALSVRMGASFFDADDYFWLPTEVPYQEKRDEAERLGLILVDLRKASSAIVAGSIVEWGAELEDGFSLIVFLTLAAEVRVARLRVRELAERGRIDSGFLEWAAQYEEGRRAGRSRPRHEKWLAERTCAVLRLDGDLKVDDGRLCGWKAVPPRRRLFLGTTMASGRDLPHDLAQFVVEATLDLHHGFWGLLANGATFIEHVVNAHVAAWRTGTSTPAAPALDAMYARWKSLPVGEELWVDWPTRRISRVSRATIAPVSPERLTAERTRSSASA